MDQKTRRTFLKRLGQGAIGSLAMPVFGGSLNDYWEKEGLAQGDVASEAYWELVKTQFNMAQGLHYFNNASLGASSEAIRKATSEFRDLLDGFPSKYMWGGWEKEKENVRTSVADLFSVEAEEIALIHNTTEGMNLIARSFDFQPGD